MLRECGVMARGIAVYETVERAPAKATLTMATTVLLHSPRAARGLAAILAERPAPNLRVLCLSKAVAAPLAGLIEPGSVAVAPRPDESAMLELLTA